MDQAVSAVVVAKKDAETENLREELQEHARAKLADSSAPSTSSSSTTCRATPQARSSSANYGKSSEPETRKHRSVGLP